MTFGPLQIQPGMAVIDTRGQSVGRVVEVQAEHFVIDQAAERSTELTYGQIRSIIGDQIVLDTGPDLDRGV